MPFCRQDTIRSAKAKWDAFRAEMGVKSSASYREFALPSRHSTTMQCMWECCYCQCLLVQDKFFHRNCNCEYILDVMKDRACSTYASWHSASFAWLQAPWRLFPYSLIGKWHATFFLLRLMWTFRQAFPVAEIVFLMKDPGWPCSA
jgi:hypothetical protein